MCGKPRARGRVRLRCLRAYCQGHFIHGPYFRLAGPTLPESAVLSEPLMTFLYRQWFVRLDFLRAGEPHQDGLILEWRAASDHVVPSASAQRTRRIATYHSRRGYG